MSFPPLDSDCAQNNRIHLITWYMHQSDWMPSSLIIVSLKCKPTLSEHRLVTPRRACLNWGYISYLAIAELNRASTAFLVPVWTASIFLSCFLPRKFRNIRLAVLISPSLSLYCFFSSRNLTKIVSSSSGAVWRYEASSVTSTKYWWKSFL